MRVLVFGSRAFADRDMIHRHLDALATDLSDDEVLVVITGAARGADHLATGWAVTHDRGQPELYAANWDVCTRACPPGHRRKRLDGNTYCPFAGHRRNQQMLDIGRPDVAIGYVDKPLAESRGSADMHRRLLAAGVQTSVHETGARS